MYFGPTVNTVSTMFCQDALLKWNFSYHLQAGLVANAYLHTEWINLPTRVK